MLPLLSTASPGCASENSAVLPPNATAQSCTVTSRTVFGGSAVATVLKGMTREVSCAPTLVILSDTRVTTSPKVSLANGFMISSLPLNTSAQLPRLVAPLDDCANRLKALEKAEKNLASPR
jgi:hypothetical protein